MRCKYDHKRLEPEDMLEKGGVILHVSGEKQTPVDPPHEVIEGRLVDMSGDLPTLKLIELPVNYARNP